MLGLARNERLVEMIQVELGLAQMAFAASEEAERVFKELEYCTRDSWSRSRRVVAKAEYLQGKDNPRFVVTSLSAAQFDARALYEDVYMPREKCGLAEGRAPPRPVPRTEVSRYLRA